jgi:hypothetical protein
MVGLPLAAAAMTSKRTTKTGAGSLAPIDDLAMRESAITMFARQRASGGDFLPAPQREQLRVILRRVHIIDEAIEHILDVVIGNVEVLQAADEDRNAQPKKSDRITEVRQLRTAAVELRERLYGVSTTTTASITSVLWKTQRSTFESSRNELDTALTALGEALESVEQNISNEPRMSQRTEARDRALEKITAAIDAQSPKLQGRDNHEIASELIRTCMKALSQAKI